MDDVLGLLLSISEDPTVDFTYRLSALKALKQREGRIVVDTGEQWNARDVRETTMGSDRSSLGWDVRHRFGPN